MSKNFIARWWDKLFGREESNKAAPDNAIPKPEDSHVRSSPAEEEEPKTENDADDST